MTLLETFEKVSFEDLVDPLIAIDAAAKDNLYSFKEAFDLLRMMEAQPSDSIDIDIAMNDYEDGNPPRPSAWFHVHEDWEIMLSRHIVVSKDCNISLAEVAAILLWEITYWGFSPSEEDEHFDYDAHIKGNPYVEHYEKLSQRHHDLNCRYHEDIGSSGYRLKTEGDLYWLPRRNGPKRHRERRLEKMIEKLERKMNRWDLCERLVDKLRLKDERADMMRDEIMNGSSFRHYYMQSRTAEGNEIRYLVELIRDYFPSKEGSKAIILFSGPERIIEDDNLELVWDALCSFCKIPSPRKHLRSANENLKDLCVDILIFE